MKFVQRGMFALAAGICLIGVAACNDGEDGKTGAAGTLPPGAPTSSEAGKGIGSQPPDYKTKGTGKAGNVPPPPAKPN